MAITNFQLALNGATWVDANSQFLQNNLPDRIPDELAIQNSLYNLFNCPIGARGKIFQPEYGSEWYAFLQEPIDDITAASMQIGMIQTLKRWEPRIILDYSRTSITANLDIPGYEVVIAGFDSLTKSSILISFLEKL
jgi:phage baseplate assembly protein W